MVRDREIKTEQADDGSARARRKRLPEAVQVSDRWYLLRNLGNAVRAVVDRHHGAIQRATQRVNEPPSDPVADDAAAVPAIVKMTTAQRRSRDAHARRHGHHEQAAPANGRHFHLKHRHIDRGRTRGDPPLASRRQGTALKKPPCGATLTPTRTTLMVVGPKSAALGQILAAAAETSLKGFADGLRRDINAIQTSLDLPWTTSPVEGQINQPKMLKRTMYGRAGFNFYVLACFTLHSATTARKMRESQKFIDIAMRGQNGGFGVDRSRFHGAVLKYHLSTAHVAQFRWRVGFGCGYRRRSSFWLAAEAA
jgi:hypothetical protein